MFIKNIARVRNCPDITILRKIEQLEKDEKKSFFSIENKLKTYRNKVGKRLGKKLEQIWKQIGEKVGQKLDFFKRKKLGQSIKKKLEMA